MLYFNVSFPHKLFLGLFLLFTSLKIQTRIKGVGNGNKSFDAFMAVLGY